MSHNYEPAPEGKDPVLWEIAQKRAAFKKHAVVYLIVNAFLWALWYFTANQVMDLEPDERWVAHFPWPVWSSLGWGIGLAFQFAGAYIFPHSNSVENEYQKLKNKQ
jgi:hypothetical protein